MSVASIPAVVATNTVTNSIQPDPTDELLVALLRYGLTTCEIQPNGTVLYTCHISDSSHPNEDFHGSLNR